jgi:hypothetical protein
MENNLNNLPPFYVGQKVVYTGWRKDLRGKIYTVDLVVKADCGCWNIFSSTLPDGYYNQCANCFKTSRTNGTVGCAISFSPLQESVFPSLKLSKVIEKESQLVSMN